MNLEFIRAIRADFLRTFGYPIPSYDELITLDKAVEVKDFGVMYLMGPLHQDGF